LPSLVIAKGDYVILMYDQATKDPNDTSKTYTYHRFEMVRLRDGKIDEHWDIADRRLNSQSWKLAWCSKSGRTDCPQP
jgi:predicted SnoaL-like aldol condensation-catalyzing enzyme